MIDAAAHWTGHDLRGALFFAVVVIAAVVIIRWVVLNVAAEGYWVYEIDTDEGDLLYVGSCGDVAKRMKAHKAYQAKLPDGHPRKWWPDAAAEVQANMWPSRCTWYRSKPIAQEVERTRIRQKNPIANRIRYKSIPAGGE